MSRLFGYAPIAVVIFGAVAGAYAARMGALAVVLSAQAPQAPFDVAHAPSPPDYSEKSAWAADGGDAGAGPPGAMENYPESRRADVFFIHPTSYFSTENWNQPIDDVQTNARTDSGAIRNQASVFNLCCRVYAPRYRQMTFGGFLAPSASSKGAMDLAYSDVKRGFEYYVAHYNHGRPFIVAGHSQGSRYARRLIEEEIDGTRLRNQFVAGYAVGNWIEESWFARLKTIKPCERADDTGCILTWNTLAEGSDAQAQRVDFARRSGAPPELANQPFACTNPLTWLRSTTLAPASLDIGGWIYGHGVRPRQIDPHLVSARCDDGALFVSEPDDVAYRIAMLPGGNYHNYDYQLAYMNIRKNAKDRVDAFVASHKSGSPAAGE